MSGRSWFVAVGDKQEGPYSEDEFRDLIARGAVRADTYVWADGMPAWQFAGDVPGLLSSGRTPPSIPRQGGAIPAESAQSGQSFSIDFSIWEMTGRALIFVIGFLLVIPAPWVAASFYGWVISRVHVPGRGQLGFTGKPLDIWYVFVALALLTYVGQSGIGYIELLVFPLQAFLSWLSLRWVIANISAQGQPLGLSFTGNAWTYIGWYLLFYLSIITIIGWAWVITAWMRWLCANVEGTRRAISFNATGLEMLWRTLVFSIACIFIIPIPWMIRWYGQWYIAQFSASGRV
ncbi:DUF4339 domain-containing protein [Bradyrhizobium sp. G127]|jgi:hypothetical protein|uniref:DUF4339 domain-containing protein n=1 Tax=Bradyrhizobium sp. G127 TaxID=2904800 RepID=UPI001F217929|nr:DUF4339 domain-containing protein [Bradyrhizobium sp. G127]MCF2521317.1 DUF4339 domain-containing protein [Bradyrhizobium sp. G127]